MKHLLVLLLCISFSCLCSQKNLDADSVKSTLGIQFSEPVATWVEANPDAPLIYTIRIFKKAKDYGDIGKQADALNTIALLIKYGAHVNFYGKLKDEERNTSPLIEATRPGALDIHLIELLLKKGADAAVKDHKEVFHTSPFLRAVSAKVRETKDKDVVSILKLLTTHGANPFDLIDGDTLVDLAIDYIKDTESEKEMPLVLEYLKDLKKQSKFEYHTK